MGRILLIEDEPGAQLLFRNRLEDLGHEVVAASTGAQGLMEARAGTFDLFLVDVVLGSGIDGYEVCRRIKAMPQKQGIPVVLISGQIKNREDLHRGYAAGCEAFLLKGDLPLLEDVVRAMLNMKALQDDLALQNRLLEEQNRRLQEERQRGADLETALRETGNRSLVFRELAAGRPDGILLVDVDGVVRYADRGAIDVLGKDLQNKNLGSLAPASGLEAFVRDARNEPREGFRFDITIRGGKAVRSLSASVMPTVAVTGGDGALRAVLLLDAGKRRVAAEMLRLQEHGIPRREIGPLLEAARLAYAPGELVGQSDAIVDLRRRVAEAARSDAPALVRGGQGTGKERVARTLHFAGERSGPFVPLDCAAVAPNVVESELFGHQKGATSEAIADRPGLFQQAHLGTLFLEHVDELPEPVQEKVAVALRDGEVRRVGASRAELVDVRLVASTEVDVDAEPDALHPELRDALGRLDLKLPDLAQRAGDAEVLARHFLSRYGCGRPLELDEVAAAAIRTYRWPGNVRELENAVERACALAEGERVEVEHLPPLLQDEARKHSGEGREIAAAARREPVPGTHSSDGPRRRHQLPSEPQPTLVEEIPVSLAAYERACLLAALRETGGDKLAAARLLGVGKSTLYRKLKSHEIT